MYMLKGNLKKIVSAGIISGLVFLVNSVKSEEDPITKYNNCMEIAQKNYEECLSTSKYLLDQCLDGCTDVGEIEICTDNCFDDNTYRDDMCKDDYDVDTIKCKGKSDLE